MTETLEYIEIGIEVFLYLIKFLLKKYPILFKH